MEQKYRITAIGPNDAYRDDAKALIGRELFVISSHDWGNSWKAAEVQYADTEEHTAFHQVQLEPVSETLDLELGTIKEVVMRRDGCSSDDFDTMMEGALTDFNDGKNSPEEILADWFGLEPDYVTEFLEIAAAR